MSKITLYRLSILETRKKGQSLLYWMIIHTKSGNCVTFGKGDTNYRTKYVIIDLAAGSFLRVNEWYPFLFGLILWPINQCLPGYRLNKTRTIQKRNQQCCLGLNIWFIKRRFNNFLCSLFCFVNICVGTVASEAYILQWFCWD